MITFIVRTYNSAEYVLDCLRSIDAQTCPDWRCVVVDDNSDDDTFELVKSFADDDARYVVTRVPEGRGNGPTNALINAVQYVNTDWWAVVDSDDLLHPKAVECAGKYLGSYPTPVMVYSPHNVQYSALTSAVVSPVANIPWSRDNLLKRFITQQLCVFNANAVRSVGGINPHFLLAADYDLSLRVSERGKVIRVPVCLYTKRVYFGGVSQRHRAKQIDFCCRAVEEAYGRSHPTFVFKVTHNNGSYDAVEV